MWQQEARIVQNVLEGFPRARWLEGVEDAVKIAETIARKMDMNMER